MALSGVRRSFERKTPLWKSLKTADGRRWTVFSETIGRLGRFSDLDIPNYIAMENGSFIDDFPIK